MCTVVMVRVGLRGRFYNTCTRKVWGQCLWAVRPWVKRAWYGACRLKPEPPFPHSKPMICILVSHHTKTICLRRYIRMC